MGKSKKKLKGGTGKPGQSKDLSGFKIDLNSYGEIESNLDIQIINEFLDHNLPDKKINKKYKKKSNS